jgi:hypothetical protein
MVTPANKHGQVAQARIERRGEAETPSTTVRISAPDSHGAAMPASAAAHPPQRGRGG